MLLVRKIAKYLMLVLYNIFILFSRVNKKIIIFESNLGRNYSGNPRFIYEEMVRRGLDKQYSCFFILEDTRQDLPGHAIKVKRLSLKYFYLFARAGFWVSDTRMPNYLRKRKKTVYIQCWHGTPLKRLGLDLEQISMESERSLSSYKRNLIRNTRKWDYLISQNSYSSEIFRRAFNFNKKILEIGYPRNDILFQKNNRADIAEIKRRLGLPEDKRLILYAPTWRDDEHYGRLKYKFSTRLDFDYLQSRLSGEYALIVKAHYLVGERPDFSAYEGFIYPFGADFDIAELYLVADLLITDYSSVMFDYSILNRPMIFFAYDISRYKDNIRGFYFDFMKEAPGPIATDTKQLTDIILTASYRQYEDRLQAFRRKFNHADDGNASAKVVELIISLS